MATYTTVAEKEAKAGISLTRKCSGTSIEVAVGSDNSLVISTVSVKPVSYLAVENNNSAFSPVRREEQGDNVSGSSSSGSGSGSSSSGNYQCFSVIVHVRSQCCLRLSIIYLLCYILCRF